MVTLPDLTMAFRTECNIGDLVEVSFSSGKGSEGDFYSQACGYVVNLYPITLHPFLRSCFVPEDCIHKGFLIRGRVTNYRRIGD